jgi:RNA polymerase sigma factor (TIGR02999 family)
MERGGSSSLGITHLLRRLTRGDPDVSEELLLRVYEELRDLARRRMSRERSDHTLEPTALVHEAYLRLVGDAPVTWENRAHFFGAAAEAMRRILVEHARRRVTRKRGGGMARVALEGAQPGILEDPEKTLALDEALSRMSERNPRGAEVVRLRFFAGLSIEEAAEVMDLSPRTLKREWEYAKAALYKAMRDDG